MFKKTTIYNNDGSIYSSDGFFFDDDGHITDTNNHYATADIEFDFTQDTYLLTREEVEERVPAWILGDLDTKLLGVDLGVIDPSSLYVKYEDEDTISGSELHTLRLRHF